jgi:hypothetical protein
MIELYILCNSISIVILIFIHLNSIWLPNAFHLFYDDRITHIMSFYLRGQPVSNYLTK